MSLLSGLDVDTSMEKESDKLGGGFGPLESGSYTFIVDTVYIDTSSGGAVNINFVFKSQDGKQLRQTIYITSNESKGKLPYYVRDGKKLPLPGFNIANSIALLTVGKQINEVDADTKVLSLYDYDAKKEIPQQKEVIMELLGQEVTLGIHKVIVDKKVKNSEGVYVPSGETRTINEIDKVFRAEDNLTVSEINDGVTEATFHGKWVKANEGKMRDKTEAKKGEVKSSNDSAGIAGEGELKVAVQPKKLFGK